MTPFNEKLFLVSLESMSIGTQFNDSLNEANIYPSFMMGYGQPSGSRLIDEEYDMSNYYSST